MTPLLAIAQGAYYAVTGIWPILSMGTFEAITGPKTDDWLVQTVGMLVIVIGLALIAAGLKRQIGAPVRILAIGSACGFAAVEYFYGLQGAIWPIYLLDAVGQTLLVGLWIAATARDRRRARLA